MNNVMSAHLQATTHQWHYSLEAIIIDSNEEQRWEELDSHSNILASNLKALKSKVMRSIERDPRVFMPVAVDFWEIHPPSIVREWSAWHEDEEKPYRVTLTPHGFDINSVLSDEERQRIEEYLPVEALRTTNDNEERMSPRARSEAMAQRQADFASGTRHEGQLPRGLSTAQIPGSDSNADDSLEALLSDMGTLIDEQESQ